MPPVNLQMQSPSVNIHIWDMDEPLSFFLQRTRLTAAEQDVISNISGSKRQLEYIVQRFLLQEYNVEYNIPILMKTPNGKPILASSQFQVSITHSGPLLALSRSRREHGIDLERLDGIVRRGDQIFYYSLSFEILEDYIFTLAYPMHK